MGNGLRRGEGILGNWVETGIIFLMPDDDGDWIDNGYMCHWCDDNDDDDDDDDDDIKDQVCRCTEGGIIIRRRCILESEQPNFINSDEIQCKMMQSSA